MEVITVQSIFNASKRLPSPMAHSFVLFIQKRLQSCTAPILGKAVIWYIWVCLYRVMQNRTVQAITCRHTANLWKHLHKSVEQPLLSSLRNDHVSLLATCPNRAFSETIHCSAPMNRNRLYICSSNRTRAPQYKCNVQSHYSSKWTTFNKKRSFLVRKLFHLAAKSKRECQCYIIRVCTKLWMCHSKHIKLYDMVYLLEFLPIPPLPDIHKKCILSLTHFK